MINFMNFQTLLRTHTSRMIQTCAITNNITYVSNGQAANICDRKSMIFNKQIEKPICVLFGWLSAQSKYVKPYETLCLNRGYEVLRVTVDVWNCLEPAKGSQIVARDLLEIMTANKATYVLYGFSIGTYIWSEAMVHASKNINLYQATLDRVVAQVWDSPGDLTYIPTGVPYTIFPKNKLCRTVTAFFHDFWYKYYLKVCFETVTRHYERANGIFLNTLCRAPALFLISKSDPITNHHAVRRVYETWRQSGIKATLQCWDKSFHVLHYKQHPLEYKSLFDRHLNQYVGNVRI